MTSDFLLGDLRRDEGLRLKAYPDPISHGEPWTIGYGHTGPDVEETTEWTIADAETALAADVAKVQAGLDHVMPWWRKLDDLRQDSLANMAFNLGVAGLAGFHTFLDFMERGLFALAANDLLTKTKWAKQLPDRAQRVALQIRTGRHVF